MPAITNTALVDSGAPLLEYYLALVPRSVAMKASVNNASATWNDTSIVYDGISEGSELYVRAGHTLAVWNSAETTYRGKVRVRSIATATNTITVAANDDIQWTDDDIIIVYDIYEPWPRPTYMYDTGVGSGIIYYKDTDVAWSSNNASFPPKANGGASFAGFLTGGYCDVVFPGADLSLPIAPGATIASYSWDIGDGAFQVGDATTGNITARFTHARFRWVHLTVTDSNGETGIHHIPVWTFGDGYDPIRNFEIQRRTYDIRDGELTLEAFETALTDSDVYDGAHVVLFSREWVESGEVTDDLGSFFAGRRQVRFDGWVMKNSVKWSYDTGAVTFTIGTIGKMADELRGYATFLEDVDSPDNWHEASSLTLRMTIHFLIHWHTNLDTLATIEYFDFDAADDSGVIAGRNFPAAAPLRQIENALLYERGVFARIGCSRWGSIHFRYDPQELPSADRATRATVIHLNNQRLYNEVTIERDSTPKASAVLGGGIVYDGSDGTAYRARAPGRTGLSLSAYQPRMDNLIITSQTQLNNLLGAYLGAVANEFDEIPLEVVWDVFEPALQEYITFDVDPTQCPRGYTFDSDTKWILRRVDVTDTPGNTPEVKITAEWLTDPYQGVTVVIPEVPDFPWPAFPAPLPLPFPEEPTVLGERLLVATDYGMYMTGDLSSTFPTWEPIGTALIGRSIYDFAIDPDNNRRLVAIEATSGFGSTTFGDVWMISDYRTGEWVKVLDGTAVDADIAEDEEVDPSQINGYFARAEVWDSRAIVVAYYANGAVDDQARTYIGGANWSPSLTMGAMWIDPALGWPDDRRFYQDRDHGFLTCQNGTITFVGLYRSTWPCDIIMTSTDYGNTWTRQEFGPNRPAAEKFPIRGGLYIEGDYYIWITYNAGLSNVCSLEKWTGGTLTARTVIEDWTTADGFSHYQGFRRQVIYGADVSFLWLRGDDVIDPGVAGKYGDTYIYKDGGWPSVWNTVAIPIYGTSADSLWSDPENMVAIGNEEPYDGDLGLEQLIMLVTAEGTAVANKSGTGATGLYGLGATYVNRVLFDQWED